MMLGAIPSPKDERDYTLAKSIRIVDEKLPDTYLPSFNAMVKDQGEVGKCVASAKSSTREDREYKQNGKKLLFSEDFLYANRADDDWQGSGMYPREALKSLQKNGIVPMGSFRYWGREYPELKKILTPMLETLLPIAYPYRISAYYRTYDTRERLLSLLNLGSQTFTFPLWESFLKTGKDGIVPAPSGEFLGYHEMAVYGWQTINGQKHIAGQNSWSYRFGNGGRFLYNVDYPIQESWAEEDDIKEESEDMTYGEFREHMETFLNELAAQPPSTYEESQKARQVMELLKVIQGDTNGRKRYKSFITREEMTIMLNRLYNILK